MQTGEVQFQGMALFPLAQAPSGRKVTVLRA
jgi:hypothetical protein